MFQDTWVKRLGLKARHAWKVQRDVIGTPWQRAEHLTFMAFALVIRILCKELLEVEHWLILRTVEHWLILRTVKKIEYIVIEGRHGQAHQSAILDYFLCENKKKKRGTEYRTGMFSLNLRLRNKTGGDYLYIDKANPWAFISVRGASKGEHFKHGYKCVQRRRVPLALMPANHRQWQLLLSYMLLLSANQISRQLMQSSTCKSPANHVLWQSARQPTNS